MRNTLSRIKEYIDYKSISIHRFEKEIGISNGSFASQLKRNRTIGVDRLEKILIIYTELNPYWLLTGQGKMLRKKDSYEIEEEKDLVYTLEKENKKLRKEKHQQQEMISHLMENNALLNKILESNMIDISKYKKK